MTEHDQIKLIVSEVMEAKLAPVTKDLDDIKVKLSNHIEHFAYQFTEVKNDVGWLKKFFDPESNAIHDSKSSADIAWLKWGVRLVIGVVVAQIIGLLVYFLK